MPIVGRDSDGYPIISPFAQIRCTDLLEVLKELVELSRENPLTDSSTDIIAKQIDRSKQFLLGHRCEDEVDKME